MYRGVEVAGRALFRVQGLRFDITGAEHVPAVGGAVVAMNHTAYVDPLYGGWAVRRGGRWLRFMAKQELFDNPLSGPVMRGAKQIPVDRAHGGEALPAAVSALRAGELVGVYPEGTISRSFELKQFKSGAARMAAGADVPIIPMVVWGAQRIWTKDRPRALGRTRTPVCVRIDPPISAEGDHHAVTAALRAHMSDQLERVRERYREVFGPHPPGAYWVPARLGGSAPTPAGAAEIERAEFERRASDG